MTTSLIGPVGQQAQQVTTGYDAYNELDLELFIKLLITELQSQDPLNPMDNQEILQQVSQIREIESNSKLTETLQSVLLGQNVVTASNLIGRMISGLTDDAERVTGRVGRVSIEDGVAKVHIGEHVLDLKNVAEILPGTEDGAEDQGA